MNEIERRLREMAKRIEQIKPEDLEDKEHLVNELDKKTQELESLYDTDLTPKK
jgi:TolA-binding protein